MNFFLLGKGKVGSAISRHFEKINLNLSFFDRKADRNIAGILFLAVPDSKVLELAKEISTEFKDLAIIHFCAALGSENLHLLHPYCSIRNDTDLESVTFTLWTKNPEIIETAINTAQIKYVHAGVKPSPFYHASAVLAGNFSQYLSIAALELLENEGFERKVALELLDQLMLSSLNNVRLGIEGISGPASRGDDITIENEATLLNNINPEIAALFRNINQLIKEALKDGTIFGK
jgi:hypothetical protein